MVYLLTWSSRFFIIWRVFEYILGLKEDPLPNNVHGRLAIMAAGNPISELLSLLLLIKQMQLCNYAEAYSV